MTEVCRTVNIARARDRQVLELISTLDTFKGRFSVSGGRVYFNCNPDIMPTFLPAEYPSTTPFTLYFYTVIALTLVLLHFGEQYASVISLSAYLSFIVIGFLCITRLRTKAFARFKEKDTLYRVAREALCTMYNRGSCDEIDSSGLARYNQL